MSSLSPQKISVPLRRRLHAALEAFLGYSIFEKWEKRHPAAYRKIRARFLRGPFTGFPLTLLSAVFLLLLISLFSIVQDYLAHEPIVALDARLANLLFAFRSPDGLRDFYAVTLLAAPAIVGIGVGTVASILFLRKQWRLACAFIGGFAGVEAVVFVAKLLFHRIRPEALIKAVVEDSFSFPSGHAASAAFFFGFLTYLFVRVSRRRRINALAIVVSLVLVSAVSFSRLYLGVHYLSDVLAGNLVGWLGLCAVIVCAEWLIAQRKMSAPSPKLVNMAIGAALVASILSAGIWFYFGTSPWTASVPERVTPVATSAVPALFSEGKLPRYSETLTGGAQEPLTVILVVPESCLVDGLSASGWQRADRIFPKSLWEAAKAAFFNNEYLSAPMTPSFYNARPHDFGFEKATEKQSVRSRHHARVWKTFYATPDGDVFAVTASLDTGLKWGVTHAIAPDIDTERDLLVADLEHSGLVVQRQTLSHFVPPVLGKNFAGDPYFTDGGAEFLVMTCK